MKKITLVATLGVLALITMGNTGCEGESTGSQRETEATQMLQDRMSTVVGVPAINNFTEKRQLKMLYELRDQANLVTYSYYTDMEGHLHKVCPTTSVGYGMPFSAQYTAPKRPDYNSYQDNAELMQPEPNGLYMPDSTSATWVICLGKDGKKLKPVYVEPTLIVSLEPMVSK